MKYAFTFLYLCPALLFAQPNSEYYRLKGDQAAYQACLKCIEAIHYPQGSARSQQLFDEAIKLDSTFTYAYAEKAVPYLKRGDFISWKKLIDQAVKYDPAENLGRRAWDRYQFIRDYEGAIADIEQLQKISSNDIGTGVNGAYHLQITRALCYKGLGLRAKAIRIFEEQLSRADYEPMLFDYLHLGVLKLETGSYQEALRCFQKQLKINEPLAETYYYMAQACQKLKRPKDYRKNMDIAREYYKADKVLYDPYTSPMDKIYWRQLFGGSGYHPQP